MEENEHSLRSKIFDTLEVALIVSDIDGVIVDLNLSALMLFEYQKEELIGKTVETLIPADAREKHIQHRQIYKQELEYRLMGRPKRVVAGITSSGFIFKLRAKLEPIKTLDGIFIAIEITEV